MQNVFVDAKNPIKKVNNFWSHLHFHPTDAIEDVWGQRILDSVSADKAAKKVRLYAMLEDIVLEGDNGELIYDFTDADKRFDYMVSRGFDLLVCLNFMPRAIAKDKSLISEYPRYKGKRLHTSIPSDYRLWQEICAKFVSHLIERYGEDLVSKWYFHCWNEPNCAGFLNYTNWDTVTDEYLKLYDFFAEGIKSVNKKLRIGGPSAAFALLSDAPHTDEYGPLIDAFFLKKFFNHIKNEKNFANGKIGTAFDFFSVHTYGHLFDCVKENSLDVAKCTEMLQNYRRLANDCGFEGTEMISDEWEMCGGGFRTTDHYPILEYRNGEVFSSLYFAFVEDVLKKDVDVSTIMICLSGQHDLEKDFHGTRTFATKSGFKLPIYNAYVLSGMLGETILMSETEGKVKVIPTACDNGDIVIALFNYSKNLIKLNGTVNTNLTVSLPEGKYTVTHYRLDKENCNSYTAWKELGRPEVFSQNDLETINQAAIMKPWYDDEEFEGSEFNLSTQMPDYSISLLKFKRK